MEVKAPALSPNALKRQEQVQIVHVAVIPAGVPFDRIKDPEYWVHCSRTLKVYDEIKCRAADNAWVATLLVSKVEPLSVHVWVTHFCALGDQAVKPAEEAYVVNLGGPQRWRVVRVSDGEVVHKGEPTQGDAQKWLDEFLQAA